VSFRLDTPLGKMSVRSPLIGAFNADNLAGAVGVCLTLGVELEALEGALPRVMGLPGRLERVPCDQGFDVFVDYAHTPDALAKVLDALRAVVRRELWVVFGCGGERDPSKRPLMGRAAGAADRVVITSDNPRGEPARQIIDGILSGMDEAPDWVGDDRRAAIGYAISTAEPGDVVVIAGKGHETTQEVRGAHLPFDDREIAVHWLRGR